MPFVTTLRLESGDRDRLESVVAEIKERAARKGAQLKGPHPKPVEQYSVPLYSGLVPGETDETWNYSVYVRVFEIVGHDDFARSVAHGSFPDSVYVSADVEQVSQVGD